MIVVWAIVVVAGLTLAGFASTRALRSAESLGTRLGLSPFIIGLTIMSVGTDLPEIANSISAAATGHGDLNVGDSTGSAATQLTFVLGILCILGVLKTDRRFVAAAGLLTSAALVFGALLMRDGSISHLDGALLIASWILATGFVGSTSRTRRTDQPSLFTRGVGTDVLMTLGALAVLGAGAVAAVTAFARITDDLGVPEYVSSFFILSVGTSLPELLIGGRALREGNGSLALGDILGSSLADATLSLGMGPMLFPTAVSTEAANGTFLVAAVVTGAILVLLRRPEHRWLSAALLLGLYAALFPLLLTV